MGLSDSFSTIFLKHSNMTVEISFKWNHLRMWCFLVSLDREYSCTHTYLETLIVYPNVPAGVAYHDPTFLKVLTCTCLWPLRIPCGLRRVVHLVAGRPVGHGEREDIVEDVPQAVAADDLLERLAHLLAAKCVDEGVDDGVAHDEYDIHVEVRHEAHAVDVPRARDHEDEV